MGKEKGPFSPFSTNYTLLYALSAHLLSHLSDSLALPIHCNSPFSFPRYVLCNLGLTFTLSRPSYILGFLTVYGHPNEYNQNNNSTILVLSKNKKVLVPLFPKVPRLLFTTPRRKIRACSSFQSLHISSTLTGVVPTVQLHYRSFHWVLLPLNSSRRFSCHIIYYSINSFYFACYPF